MAKYRCPVCGATHKTLPEHCRLCGQAMGEDAVVGDFSGARKVATKKKGVFGMAFVVVLGVLIIAVVLIALGIAPGSKQLNTVIEKVPGLPQQDESGWAKLDAKDGKFTVMMPTDQPEQTNEPDGTITWTAWVGLDARVLISYDPDAVSAGSDEHALNRQWTSAYEQAQKAADATVDKVKIDASFAGHPAGYLELRDVRLAEYPKERYYAKVMSFANGSARYVIRVDSRYKTVDQWDRVMGSFTLTEPAAPSTTAASVTP
ncbi:MAG: hypothetical protein N2037_12370 [Acidimicrobiales bacterium]|nr:hypothetical protein [Acidimicrobiales bacterium]